MQFTLGQVQVRYSEIAFIGLTGKIQVMPVGLVYMLNIPVIIVLEILGLVIQSVLQLR